MLFPTFYAFIQENIKKRYIKVEIENFWRIFLQGLAAPNSGLGKNIPSKSIRVKIADFQKIFLQENSWSKLQIIKISLQKNSGSKLQIFKISLQFLTFSVKIMNFFESMTLKNFGKNISTIILNFCRLSESIFWFVLWIHFYMLYYIENF